MPRTETSADTVATGLRSIAALVLVTVWAVLVGTAGVPSQGWRGLLAAFAPLGLAAVFVFPDRKLLPTRAILVAMPAFATGVVAAVAAIAFRDRAAGAPGVGDLLAPAVSVALGVLVGLAARRGLMSLVLLPFELVGVACLLAVVGLGLLLVLVESSPGVTTPKVPSAQETKTLARLLAAGDPRAIPPGEIRQIQLDEKQLDWILAATLPVAVGHGVRAAVKLAEDRLSIAFAAPVPRSGRWLNGVLSAAAKVDGGRLQLSRPRLRVGSREVPARAMEAIAPALNLFVNQDRRMRAILPAIRELRLDPGRLTVSYGKIELVSVAPGVAH